MIPQVTGNFISRFITRNTPLATLIRDILSKSAGGPYELIEDYRLPSSFLKDLSLRELLPEDGAFLLRDRKPIRMGIITCKPLTDGPLLPPEAREILRSMLEEELAGAGKKFQDYLIIPADGNMSAKLLRGRTPYFVLLWNADKTPLENILAKKEDVLQKEREKSKSKFLEQMARNSSEQPAAPIQAEDVAGGPLVAKAPEQKIKNPKKKPREEGQYWRDIKQDVLGTGHGQIKKQMLIRQKDVGMRMAMFVPPQPETENFLVNFFGNLKGAGNFIPEYKKALLHSHHQSLNCLGLEINKKYQFRVLACGIRPMLFRKSTGKLFTFPDSRVGSLKTVKGQLNEGDALFVVPNNFTENEKEILAALLAGMDTPQGRERLTNFMDFRNLGKSLLLQRV